VLTLLDRGEPMTEHRRLHREPQLLSPCMMMA
jgi:hypothetical protein